MAKQITVNRIALQAIKNHAYMRRFHPATAVPVNDPNLSQWSFPVSDEVFKALSKHCNPADIDEVSRVLIRLCSDTKLDPPKCQECGSTQKLFRLKGSKRIICEDCLRR